MMVYILNTQSHPGHELRGGMLQHLFSRAPLLPVPLLKQGRIYFAHNRSLKGLYTVQYGSIQCGDQTEPHLEISIISISPPYYPGML